MIKSMTPPDQFDKQAQELANHFPHEGFVKREIFIEKLAELLRKAAVLDWLENHYQHTKWADAIPDLRPCDESGDFTAKYIGESGITAAVLEAMQKEQSQ